MNITKNQPDALNYQVTIDINAEDYAEALRKRLNEYRRRADIKGFRKGMAPMSLIQRLYGDQSLYEAVNRLVSDQLDTFIRDEKIRVVGEPLPSEDQPQLEWKPGNDFTFKFDIAQTPELDFEVGEGDKIPYYEINVTEDAKKAMKAQMLQQYGSLQEGGKAGENGPANRMILQLNEDIVSLPLQNQDSNTSWFRLSIEQLLQICTARNIDIDTDLETDDSTQYYELSTFASRFYNVVFNRMKFLYSVNIRLITDA